MRKPTTPALTVEAIMDAPDGRRAFAGASRYGILRLAGERRELPHLRPFRGQRRQLLNGVFGELGLGDLERRGRALESMGDALPAVDLGAGRRAVRISAGTWYTCALLEDGTVKCWGDVRRLGLGENAIAGRGDEPGEMGDALPVVNLGSGRTAKLVSAGSMHAYALLDDGTVKCWGENQHGQLGLGDSGARGDDPGEMGDALPAVDLVF